MEFILSYYDSGSAQSSPLYVALATDNPADAQAYNAPDETINDLYLTIIDRLTRQIRSEQPDDGGNG
jgi:hypothetical protein